MSATAHRTPGETFAGYTQLETLSCYLCGITFGLPEHMVECARDRGNYEIEFYCPNGHKQGFGKSRLDRAQEKADREANRAARLAAERDQAKARAKAQKAAATRARNERNRARKRSADGVCPCCGRTFKQVVAHMARMHPDYDPTADHAHS